ncbi:MAG TPA: LysR family transcriptional regulator [Parvularculaceae bacterium]|nr:LysR family transcriptional regulator [Parvularculaceae bacterium]
MTNEYFLVLISKNLHHMDISAARTFIAIVESGNFVSASRRLHVTQSTVSARIKTLEDALGRELFIRNKAGCELTPAGRQFERYARAMVRAWEEGRHQVAVPAEFDHILSVGGQFSLWNGLLMRWLSEFHKISPRTALRAEVGAPQRLMREMSEGVLDIAVIYRPEHRPGLKIEELIEDDLILVTAAPEKPLEECYVFFDWGEDFREWHAAVLPSIRSPGLTLDLGALGVDYLMSVGAAGFAPERIAAPFLATGALRLVPNSPDFPYPAYVVFQERYEAPNIMESALDCLRRIANSAPRASRA